MKNFFNYVNIKNKPNFYFHNDDYIFVLNVADKEEKDTYCYGDDDSKFLFQDITSKVADEEEKDKKINSNNSKINVTVYYPSYKFLTDLKEKFDFLNKFKIQYKERNFVSVLMKDQYGEYDFVPLDIKVPKIDIGMNYGKKFVLVYNETVEKLKTKHKGLYMLS